MQYLLLSAFIVVFDQLFKKWCVYALSMGISRRLLPGILNLTMVHNYGASWGILAGKTNLLLGVTAVVCLGIIVYLLLGKPEQSMGRLSLAFILGGAIGNAVDRFVLGYVVDMFETAFIQFPVFNVADCFICVGAALLCIHVFMEEAKDAKAKKLTAGEKGA